RPDRSGCERCAASGGDQPGICQEVFPRREPAWTHDQLVPWWRQSHATDGDSGGRWRRRLFIPSRPGPADMVRAAVAIRPARVHPSLVPISISRAVTDSFAGCVERSRGGDRQGQSDTALTFRPLSDYVKTARNQELLVALLAGAFGTPG